jgi:hypothetical protein
LILLSWRQAVHEERHRRRGSYTDEMYDIRFTNLDELCAGPLVSAAELERRSVNRQRL